LTNHIIKKSGKMKVLFIGGTGIISSACTQRALQLGIDVYHLNRGLSAGIRNITGIKTITADIRNEEESREALHGYVFDVVVDFISFETEHVQTAIRLFEGKTSQYIFISSASAYQTPPEQLPVTETTPLENPYWLYSRNKIACEKLLLETYESRQFPCTIVRPSHTYDKTVVPLMGGYTTLQRMKKGLPIVQFGDGSSIWTLTHHRDFAVGLVGLFGQEKAIGECIHITSDEWLTWNDIIHILANELGVNPKIVYIPSDIIARYDPEIGAGLLGDKTHSMIFDNSKIRKFVPEFNPKIPFREGAKEIIDWFNEKTVHSEPSAAINELMDKLISDFENIGK
jgi:nucleoside-diphosphate-sugar epimerase